MMPDTQIVNHVRAWLTEIVIGLELCPFAKGELEAQRVRFSVTHAKDSVDLLIALEAELQRLQNDASIETALLIHPHALSAFDEYNQFLDLADSWLQQLQLDGIYQIASFHPDYQFADTQADDVENYTNRSPYPLLHILREASVQIAIETHSDIAAVPAANIKLMRKLGKQELQQRLAQCALAARS